MEASGKIMVRNARPLILNIGCGFRKHEDAVNIDGFAACEPDVLWDLNDFPYPWGDNTVDQIYAYHVFEHIADWWGAFRECARILKPRGELEMRVPDISSDSAIAYRDHLHQINLFSFDGVANRSGGRGMNSWAAEQEVVPMVLSRYARVPFAQYNWIPIWLIRILARHLRNFIWEQRFIFIKVKTHDGPNEIEYHGHPKTEYIKAMRPYKPEKEI
jgi:SAM-dependent methyltransferase